MGEQPEVATARRSAFGRIRIMGVALRGAVRWGLVAVFLISAVQKLLNLDVFTASVASMGFFASGRETFIAYLVPILETIAAILVGLRRAEQIGLASMTFLSGIFTGLHTYLYLRGDLVPCGCAGITELVSPDSGHLSMAIFTAILFTCATMLMFLSPRPIASTSKLR